ncbi:hypothetical protein VNO77_27346 [Canavalia gladiata]|uniref:Uncharacterized protein n=1 Tax=Canavalia gladiata TaxID=3824 RepID=A0AAN9KTV5_CANGL
MLMATGQLISHWTRTLVEFLLSPLRFEAARGNASTVQRYPALATPDSLTTSLYLHEFCATSKCPSCIDFVFLGKPLIKTTWVRRLRPGRNTKGLHTCFMFMQFPVVHAPGALASYSSKMGTWFSTNKFILRWLFMRPLRIACIGMGLNSVAFLPIPLRSIPEASGYSNCFTLNPLHVMVSPSSSYGHTLCQVVVRVVSSASRSFLNLIRHDHFQVQIVPALLKYTIEWGLGTPECHREAARGLGEVRDKREERSQPVHLAFPWVAMDRFINDHKLLGSSEAETDGRSERRDLKTKSEIRELEMTNLQSLNGGFEEEDPTLTKTSSLWWRRNRGLRTRFQSRRSIRISTKTSEEFLLCTQSFFRIFSNPYNCLWLPFFIAPFSNSILRFHFPAPFPFSRAF